MAGELRPDRTDLHRGEESRRAREEGRQLNHVIDTAVADTIVDAYGLKPVDVTQIHAGTATSNFVVTDHSGDQWFAKVYRDRADLRRERAAVELAEYARAGAVPVPGLHLTRDGELLADDGPVPMSLWHYVADAEVAEGRLTGARWQAVGSVLGRLHRHLTDHPAAAAVLRPAAEMRDMAQAQSQVDRLIDTLIRRAPLDSFDAWALDAAKQRRDLLTRATAILTGLPDLTKQVIHGDLASPNLLLRGDGVAALIDFQPPNPRFVSWEIARIGCDPKTVIRDDGWVSGLPRLLAAYRDEHPAARRDDLISTVAVGCVYTLASTYPLSELLNNPSAMDASLQAYGRARHEATLVMLDRLDEIQERLRDSLA